MDQVCDPTNDPGDAGEPIPACIPSCAVAGGKICPSDLKCSRESGLCVQCLTDTDCANVDPFSPMPYCSASGTCVQCTKSSQCSGTTPLCDTQQGTCVGCLSDHDCSGTPATPYCSDIDSTCVQCNSPSQCPASAPGCFLNSCGGCAANSDCPTGQGCYGGLGDLFGDAGLGGFGGFGGYMMCEPLCGYGGAVTPDGGLCAPCASNGECSPAGETCNASTGACG